MAVLVVLGGLALFSRDDRWWEPLRWVSTAVWVGGAVALLAVGTLYALWAMSGIGRP